MCIIVDANRLSKFANPCDVDAKPIHRWLLSGRGKIVFSYGGAFAQEVPAKAKAKLIEYSRAGIADFFPAHTLASELSRLRSTNTESDDEHVLALARVSGARLLYTGDRDLMDDFRNPHLIEGRRGKVYSRANNADLLNRSLCSS